MLLSLKPILATLGISILVIGVILVGCQLKLDRAKMQTDAANAEDLQCKSDLIEMKDDRDKLADQIGQQNRAINDLQQRGRELESASTLRAVRELREGEAKRRALLASDAGAGPEGMNLWLEESFSPAPP